MGDIFVCYRHEDAPGFAGRLADDLSERFPDSHVFRDVEGLEAGSDFTVVINANLASCAAFLAIIGRRWLESSEAGRSRLHDPDDFVRLEIAAALRHGTFVVPVLVGDAVMPAAADLPTDLAPFAKRQAHTVTDRHWDADVASLARVLAKQPGFRSRWRAVAAWRPRGKWKAALATLCLAVALLVGATRLLIREEPALPSELRLIDLDILTSDAFGPCIKPANCQTPDAGTASEVIVLNDAEIRVDPLAQTLHVLLSLRWILRQGDTDLFHRGYTGQLYYTVPYETPERGAEFVLAAPRIQDYSLSPVNGLIAFVFGWLEIPFLIERDDVLAAEVEARLRSGLAARGSL